MSSTFYILTGVDDLNTYKQEFSMFAWSLGLPERLKKRYFSTQRDI